MNIDMTFDYDKLLEEAKKRYEKVLKLDKESTKLFIYNAKSEEYRSVQKKFNAAMDEFLDWEEKNIRKFGARLILDLRNGAPIGIAPIGIDAVISGHDNWGRGTH